MTHSPHEQAVAIREYFQRRYKLAEPPASQDDIAEAERQIGMSLPPVLRELYLLCNGFGGPLGTWYLAPLFGEGMSLVELTDSIRLNAPEDTSGFVAFGINAGDHPLAMRQSDTGSLRIVSCDAEAPTFLDLGQDLFQVYLTDEQQCEQDIGEKLGEQ